MNGLPLSLLVFIVLFVVAVVQSKTRLKTTLHILGVVAVIIALGFAMSKILGPGWAGAMGTLTAPIAVLTGIIASIIELLRNRKQSPTKSRDLP